MQKAFQELKEAICQAPVLSLPDFQKLSCVETDASAIGVGAILQQQGKPVAFFSKALGINHQALSIYNKKCSQPFLAVKKWHPYLVGKQFLIKTDHQTLKFLSEEKAITPF